MSEIELSSVNGHNDLYHIIDNVLGISVCKIKWNTLFQIGLVFDVHSAFISFIAKQCYSET